MNLAKSVFVTLYVVFLLVSGAYCVVGYVNSNNDLVWVSAFLASTIPLLYFAYLFLRKPTGVQNASLVVSATSAAATLITIGDTFFNQFPGRIPLILALIAFTGWMLYSNWYSKLPKRKQSAEMEGKQFPALNVLDSKGNTSNPISQTSAMTLVIFHRGAWCPFCVAQVRSLIKESERFKAASTTISLISPLSPKLGSFKEDVVKFYQDSEFELAQSVGAYQKSGVPMGLGFLGFGRDTNYPMAMIVDQNRIVKYVHQPSDYRKRPSPEFFLRLIDSHLQNRE